MKISASAKKAALIGSICSLSYLAVYLSRNILGAVSPQMIETGAFTTESIGTLSSVYFFTYAIGQLLNGAIGDKLKAKYMVGFGLILSGVFSFLFLTFSKSLFASYVFYGLTGFFLSMIYGPVTKIVAENTEPIYATRCCLGYTFASLLSTPLAGVLATLLVWDTAFVTSGAILLAMGCFCFVVFLIFEKKGLIVYNQFKPHRLECSRIELLIKHQIIKFTLISILTGIVRTTVVFWLPTYISQYLGFSSDKSALIFTVSTLFISLTDFIAVFIYEHLRRNVNLTMLIAFSSSAVCFLCVFLFRSPLLNIIFLVLAIMSSGCASTMLWNQYCLSLKDTGMVSSATGFLDFVSYISAAVSSTLFANTVTGIGWSNLILICLGLMVSGIIVTLPFDKFSKKAAEQR